MENCDYSAQRPWSDRFLGQDKQILSSVFGCDIGLIEVTSPEIDMQRAADLLIKSPTGNDRDIHVAVRTRKGAYTERYSDEFTVRAHYTAGHKTEYEKIMEGHADIMLYGFVVDDVKSRWILLDLDIFRKEAEEEYIVREHKQNRDGRNSFYAYNIKSFLCSDTHYPDILLGWSEGYFSEDVIATMHKNYNK